MSGSESSSNRATLFAASFAEVLEGGRGDRAVFFFTEACQDFSDAVHLLHLSKRVERSDEVVRVTREGAIVGILRGPQRPRGTACGLHPGVVEQGLSGLADFVPRGPTFRP